MVEDWKSIYLKDLMAGGRYGLREYLVPKVCSEREVWGTYLAEFNNWIFN